jgi:hypothetical protein
MVKASLLLMLVVLVLLGLHRWEHQHLMMAAHLVVVATATLIQQNVSIDGGGCKVVSGKKQITNQALMKLPSQSMIGTPNTVIGSMVLGWIVFAKCVNTSGLMLVLLWDDINTHGKGLLLMAH